MMKMVTTVDMPNYGPSNDLWDPIYALDSRGNYELTSIELTISNQCNMRCEHCAVGDSLTPHAEQLLPLYDVLRMLDEVEHLQTISITGGEPTLSKKIVQQYMIPILKYAKERGVLSQLNSNITLDYSHYEPLLPYLDVLHISYNYTNAKDFHDIGFARAGHAVGYEVAARLYDRMVNNAKQLATEGMFVSAESMINYRTYDKLEQIHHHIVELGCKRHEVHPMYPSDFAAQLPMLTLSQTRDAIHNLLDTRDQNVWMLFGTLPFYACNSDSEDQRLLQRLRHEPLITMRNDPDGRNRLNVDLFTGDVRVTDFAEVPPLGNMKQDRLETIFARWREHSLSKSIHCHCPSAKCCGPNLLVADMYYQDVDFQKRRALC